VGGFSQTREGSGCIVVVRADERLARRRGRPVVELPFRRSLFVRNVRVVRRVEVVARDADAASLQIGAAEDRRHLRNPQRLSRSNHGGGVDRDALAAQRTLAAVPHTVGFEGLQKARRAEYVRACRSAWVQRRILEADGAALVPAGGIVVRSLLPAAAGTARGERDPLIPRSMRGAASIGNDRWRFGMGAAFGGRHGHSACLIPHGTGAQSLSLVLSRSTSVLFCFVYLSFVRSPKIGCATNQVIMRAHTPMRIFA
jgi:hypothetical protein